MFEAEAEIILEMVGRREGNSSSLVAPSDSTAQPAAANSTQPVATSTPDGSPESQEATPAAEEAATAPPATEATAEAPAEAPAAENETPMEVDQPGKLYCEIIFENCLSSPEFQIQNCCFLAAG